MKSEKRLPQKQTLLRQLPLCEEEVVHTVQENESGDDGHTNAHIPAHPGGDLGTGTGIGLVYEVLPAPAIAHDAEQAEHIFDALRIIDESGAEKVFAHSPKVTGIGLAVYNRLIRAAGFDVIEL